MTWRNWMWQGPFRWLMAGIVLSFVVILVFMLRDDELGQGELWIGVIALGITTVFIVPMHNWLTIEPDVVRLGFWPVYRRTIPLADIANVGRVTVQPIAHYGGWGVKGMAMLPHGILLGGSPPTGVRIETLDDKRYVVTFKDTDPILTALHARGCTLSADHRA